MGSAGIALDGLKQLRTKRLQTGFVQLAPVSGEVEHVDGHLALGVDQGHFHIAPTSAEYGGGRA